MSVFIDEDGHAISRSGPVPTDLTTRLEAGTVERLRPRLDMQCCDEFDTNPDCDCPHEHWHLEALADACLDVHFEDDGSAHFTFECDGVENDKTVHGLAGIEQARNAAFEWVDRDVWYSPQPVCGLGR